MIKPPYPIVKCRDHADKVWLMTSLFNMGFRRNGFKTLADSLRDINAQYHYLLIRPVPGTHICFRPGLNEFRNHTLVNSAAHFVDYIKMSGIKP